MTDLEIERLIAERMTARVGRGEDGSAIWIGESHWPAYIGWPWHVESLPWKLRLIRKDPPTHCGIYVRED